jgi:hypothetical protein
VRPEISPILGELSVPLEEVALLIAQNENARVQLSGESALLALKLSTQVPAQSVFYTDGRNRLIRRKNALFRLRHVSPKIMVCAGTEAAPVLSALYVLGRDAVTPALLQHIRAVLPPNALTALWQKRGQMIGWMRVCVERLMLMEPTS